MFDYLVILFTFVLGAYTVYSDRKISEKKKPKKIQYIKYFLLTLIFLSGSAEIYQNRFNTSNWHQGDILGSEVDRAVLKIGTANFVTDLDTLIRLVDDPIGVWIYDGKLHLNSIVRDKNGEVIVSISGNHFIVNPNTISDFNYDAKALEVRDKSGDVVFQIQMQKDGVLYCGKFYTTNGYQVVIGNNRISMASANEPIEIYFEKIFKYPRWANPGIRVIK